MSDDGSIIVSVNNRVFVRVHPYLTPERARVLGQKLISMADLCDAADKKARAKQRRIDAIPKRKPKT